MANPRSLYAFILSSLLLMYCAYVFYPRWQKNATEATIAWDASGYYWPLPSAIIYKDVTHHYYADSILKKYTPTPDFQQAIHFEPNNDRYIFRYTFGMSVLYSPFFIAAHLLAEPLGYPADGFSRPYQFAIQTGALIVALLGMWYMRKLFLKYYKDTTVAVLLLLLCFGTNYLNYAGIDNALSHSWLFSLYVFLLWNTHLFHQSPKYKYAIRIGIIIGLIALVRPTEIICCLIPFLWGMNGLTIPQIKKQFSFLMSKWKMLFVAGIITGTFIFLQLLYWELSTTYWVMDTYPGQKFTFDDPHFYDYMFSYRSGWATYTPMAFLMMAGFLLYFFKGKNKLPIILFSLINLYIVCSWQQWWYSGTGGRAMIQSYPVLFFPFATLIETCWKNFISRWLFIVLAFIGIYVNIWFTYQAHTVNGTYDPEFMNESYYWGVVGKWKVPDEYKKMKDYDEFYEGTPKNLKLIHSNDFENDSTITQQDFIIDGKKTLVLDTSYKGTGWVKIARPAYAAQRVRYQATFHCVMQEWNKYAWTQMIVRFYNGEQVVKEKAIYADRFISDGVTRDIFIDVKVPQEKIDSIGISLWSPNITKPLYIDNLKVWTFDE